MSKVRRADSTYETGGVCLQTLLVMALFKKIDDDDDDDDAS